jgi:hypothetical protein
LKWGHAGSTGDVIKQSLYALFRVGSRLKSQWLAWECKPFQTLAASSILTQQQNKQRPLYTVVFTVPVAAYRLLSERRKND